MRLQSRIILHNLRNYNDDIVVLDGLAMSLMWVYKLKTARFYGNSTESERATTLG